MKRILFYLALIISTHFIGVNSAFTSENVEPSLILQKTSIEPGSEFWLGVRFEMREKWHTYWKNPGDSGGPPQFNFTLPAGFELLEQHWPMPDLIETPPLITYGYEDEVLHLFKLKSPRHIPFKKNVTITADIKWLECADVCIPGRATVSQSFPFHDDKSNLDPKTKPVFDKFFKRLPQQNPDYELSALNLDETILVRIFSASKTLADLGAINFYSDQPNVVQTTAKLKAKQKGNSIQIHLPKSHVSTVTAKELTGIFVSDQGWGEKGNVQGLMVSVPIDEGVATKANSVWIILIFAFMGGLLLNLMPCVLPVLSLKIFDLIKHKNNKRSKNINNALFYTLGVVLSFVALAVLLIIFKKGGEFLGWGFQLQSPIFVGMLSILFFILGLSFLGVVEFGIILTRLGHKFEPDGILGSFFTGLLATIVATPCTAPFMGTAIGFALTQPNSLALGVFASLGLGMATPFLMVATFPKLLVVIPKPGAWMDTLKQMLGFVLIGTNIWLIWVIGQQIGIYGVTVILMAHLIVGIAVWVWSKWGNPNRRRPVKIRAAFVAAFMVLGSVLLVISLDKEKSFQKQTLDWVPFSQAEIEAHREEGQFVLVNFTAAWCLTCQVNDRLVFRNKDVIEFIESKNIVAMKADWTNRDERITHALERLGRSGIPVYVIYSPDPDPRKKLLPEILTPTVFINGVTEFMTSIQNDIQKEAI